jgi:DNA modification methylase
MTTDTLTLRYIPLSQARQWERNPKQHDLGAIARSIALYGFKDPLKYEPALNGGQGGLVEGNGRAEALAWMQTQGHDLPRGLGIAEGEWQVPVLFGVDALSQETAEAYAIDHNNLVLAGGTYTAVDIANLWDESAYLDVLTGLAEHKELPVSVSGDDLDLLLGLADEESAPGAGGDGFAPDEDAPCRVRRGDLWLIDGTHRILCADSTDPVAVARVVQGAPVALVVTDPPYGINYNRHIERPRHADLANDAMPQPHRLLAAFPPAEAWYIWSRWDVMHKWIEALPEKVRNVIVWDKIEYSKGDPTATYAPSWEVCIFASRPGHALRGKRDRDLWQAGRPPATEHLTPKPVELIQRCIEKSSDEGALVFDGFLGSGPTLIAAHRLRRVLAGIEIEPRYVDVTLQRAEAEGLCVELAERDDD